jgi:hypothetical protein
MGTRELKAFRAVSRLLAGLVTALMFAGAASAQQSPTTTATSLAPAVINTDASGNLLIIERRAANSIPGAPASATGLVTRIVIVPPQGGNPSTLVYAGTMDNFALGERALFSILTVTGSGKTSKYLVAIDGGSTGVLPATLPSVAVTLTGTSDVRVVNALNGKDAVYIVQTPPTVRVTPGTTTTAVAARTITYTEWDGKAFSTPKTVTEQ